MMLETTV